MLNKQQIDCLVALQELEQVLRDELETMDANSENAINKLAKPALLKAERELEEELKVARTGHNIANSRNIQDRLKEVKLDKQLVAVEVDKKEIELAEQKAKLIKTKISEIPSVVGRFFGADPQQVISFGSLTNSHAEFDDKFRQWKEKLLHLLATENDKTRKLKEECDKSKFLYERMLKQYHRLEDLRVS